LETNFRQCPFSEVEYVHGMISKEDADRRQAAKVLYDLQMGLREANMSELNYDEEQDCFRFRDGRFAFSEAKADWKLLEELGYAP
jgi:hypothetical protein